MKNILILGTSHVGALKQGLDQCLPSKAKDSFGFDYAAVPLKMFKKFTVVDSVVHVPKGALKALKKTYDHGDQIELMNYDSIVFVHGLSRLDFSLYFSDRMVAPISEDLIREIALRPIEPSLFLDLLINIPVSRLIYIGSPLISEKTTKKKQLKRVPLLLEQSHRQKALEIASLIRKACHDSLADSSMPSYLLPPPDVLTASGFNTLDHFIRGGIRYDGRVRTMEHDDDFEDDMVHGNSDYGKRMAMVLINHLNQS